MSEAKPSGHGRPEADSRDQNAGPDAPRRTLFWDDEVEAVLAGDLTAALGYRTPAGGVVVQAVAPIGLHDRDARTVGFTTSLGFSKKLERIAADPRVAVAREHYNVRVPVVVDVDRIVSWPDLRCAGPPRVTGEDLPAGDAEPHRPKLIGR
jgi:hypothetical protein